MFGLQLVHAQGDQEIRMLDCPPEVVFIKSEVQQNSAQMAILCSRSNVFNESHPGNRISSCCFYEEDFCAFIYRKYPHLALHEWQLLHSTGLDVLTMLCSSLKGFSTEQIKRMRALDQIFCPSWSHVKERQVQGDESYYYPFVEPDLTSVVVVELACVMRDQSFF